MTQFVSHIVRLPGGVWSLGFQVPEKIAAEFTGKQYKRVVCTLNEKHTFQCALMPMGEGRYCILVNAEAQKKAGLSEGSEVHAELAPDESKYGLPMPEELEQLLQMDDEGNRIFHGLTPGKQRNLLHIVGLPKTSETRLKKALVVVEYLKEVNGNLDFKELNLAFKLANRQ